MESFEDIPFQIPKHVDEIKKIEQISFFSNIKIDFKFALLMVLIVFLLLLYMQPKLVLKEPKDVGSKKTYNWMVIIIISVLSGASLLLAPKIMEWNTSL